MFIISIVCKGCRSSKDECIIYMPGLESNPEGFTFYCPYSGVSKTEDVWDYKIIEE